MKGVKVSVELGASGSLTLRVDIAGDQVDQVQKECGEQGWRSVVSTMIAGSTVERVGIFDFLLRRLARLQEEGGRGA